PIHSYCFLRPRCPPAPTLFPYTTLFRSSCRHPDRSAVVPAESDGHDVRTGRADQVLGALQRDGVHPVGQRRQAWGRGRLTKVDRDRKSTRLNSSHVKISYAVFCLKKKRD